MVVYIYKYMGTSIVRGEGLSVEGTATGHPREQKDEVHTSNTYTYMCAYSCI